jgi:hypothetical protein
VSPSKRRAVIAEVRFDPVRSGVVGPDGTPIEILPCQVLLWASLAPQTVVQLPAKTRRFPVVLDTGFNGNVMVREEQLRDWAGYGPTDLSTLGAGLVDGKPARVKRANLWLYHDRESHAPPYCVELFGGILVTSPMSDRPRLPLLGMRAINTAGLRVAIDGRTRLVTVAAPRK